MELVSGLPDDVVRECLIRVSYDQFATVASVCKGWKEEIIQPEFRRRRRATGQSQKLIVMVQALFETAEPSSEVVTKLSANPVYRLTVFEPSTGHWAELPASPEFSGGLPMFCQLASVGLDLVIMGGWDPVTWKASNSVFVYNFLTENWRRGADMPGGPRAFFSCAPDQGRMVYVAGGHDDEKNALRSALVYDVEYDKWASVPDMAMERDECKAVFHCGKFLVIGGYRTEMQGRFETTAEAFDVNTWQWDPVKEGFLEVAACPRTAVEGGDGSLLMCQNDDVVSKVGDDRWRTLSKIPDEIRNLSFVMTWQEKLLVIGSPGFGKPHMGFILDLKNGRWERVDIPENHTGHVQSGCFLEI